MFRHRITAFIMAQISPGYKRALQMTGRGVQ
nr:MAG TPA: hypothetical protein [Caudoviricetes sp.]